MYIDLGPHSEEFLGLHNSYYKDSKKYLGSRIGNGISKRKKSGLFRSSKGIIFNSDVNAGYNIIKKGIPDAFKQTVIEGVELHPYCIKVGKFIYKVKHLYLKKVIITIRIICFTNRTN